MKISNFELLEIIGTSPVNWKFRARVDVTTGFIFKKVKTVDIYQQFGSSWYFVDTGKFTPGYLVENLVRAFEADQGKPIEKCGI